MQNAASAPQAHTTENAATGPLSTDDLTDVQNRARALLPVRTDGDPKPTTRKRGGFLLPHVPPPSGRIDNLRNVAENVTPAY